MVAVLEDCLACLWAGLGGFAHCRCGVCWFYAAAVSLLTFFKKNNGAKSEVLAGYRWLGSPVVVVGGIADEDAVCYYGFCCQG